jgi:hypothetical protein
MEKKRDIVERSLLFGSVVLLSLKISTTSEYS